LYDVQILSALDTWRHTQHGKPTVESNSTDGRVVA
jgi:hypothetical protein